MDAEILARIPQRPPFLYIDSIVDRTEKTIVTKRHFKANEDFFKGHFPGDPVVPGVILCEAAFQTGALLMSYHGEIAPGVRAFVTRVQNAKFKNMVTADETITIQVTLDELVGNAAYFKAAITKDNSKVMTVDFSCMLVEKK